MIRSYLQIATINKEINKTSLKMQFMCSGLTGFANLCLLFNNCIGRSTKFCTMPSIVRELFHYFNFAVIISKTIRYVFRSDICKPNMTISILIRVQKLPKCNVNLHMIYQTKEYQKKNIECVTRSEDERISTVPV